VLAAVNRPSLSNDIKYTNTLRQDAKVKSGRISTPHMLGRKSSGSFKNKDDLTYSKARNDSPKTSMNGT
jgi:hypothetical protein